MFQFYVLLQILKVSIINSTVPNLIPEKSTRQSCKLCFVSNFKMTFTLTVVVLREAVAKFDFAACFRYVKCLFRVRLHKHVFKH
jgi:hypothetical protein